MILLNKADLIAEKELAALEEVVRRMNPAARVLRTISSKVALAEVVGTGAFHLDEIGLLQVGQYRLLYIRFSEVMLCGLGGITSIRVNEHWFFRWALKYCVGLFMVDAALNSPLSLQDTNVDDAGSKSSSSNGSEHGVALRASSRLHREEETFGVGTFTFRARRPFHSQRLMAFVMEYLPSVLRSKVRCNTCRIDQ